MCVCTLHILLWLRVRGTRARIFPIVRPVPERQQFTAWLITLKPRTAVNTYADIRCAVNRLRVRTKNATGRNRGRTPCTLIPVAHERASVHACVRAFVRAGGRPAVGVHARQQTQKMVQHEL